MSEEKSLHELMRKVFFHTKKEKVSLDFTDKIMARIENESVIADNSFLDFIKKGLSNWTYIIPLVFLIGGFVYYIITRSENLNQTIPNVDPNPYIKSLSTLFNALLENDNFA